MLTICYQSAPYKMKKSHENYLLITFCEILLRFIFLYVSLRRLSTQTERLMLNLKNTTNMDKIIILPDIADKEVRIKVPPIVQKQPLWSNILRKIGSLFTKKKTKYHIEDYLEVGDLPIVLVGCDIENINHVTIAPEYERRD